MPKVQLYLPPKTILHCPVCQAFGTVHGQGRMAVYEYLWDYDDNLPKIRHEIKDMYNFLTVFGWSVVVQEVVHNSEHCLEDWVTQGRLVFTQGHPLYYNVSRT